MNFNVREQKVIDRNLSSMLYQTLRNYHLLNWGVVLKETEKAMAPHSSTLAWKTPWMEEPGGLQSMGSLRVGHDWVTSLSLFSFRHWRRKWQPTPVLLPRESQGRRSLVGCRLRGQQSQTRLKLLSSSSIKGKCQKISKKMIELLPPFLLICMRKDFLHILWPK